MTMTRQNATSLLAYFITNRLRTRALLQGKRDLLNLSTADGYSSWAARQKSSVYTTMQADRNGG